MQWLTHLNEKISASEPVALVTVVGTSTDLAPLQGKHLVTTPDTLLASEITDLTLTTHLTTVAREALEEGRPFTRQTRGLRVYVEPFLPPPALVVVGAGHVAQPVAHVGKMLGFHVTVIDDRPAYANVNRFPEADQIICGDFVATLREMAPGPRHHLVLVTRGHRHDMAALQAVIERPVAYIGMIGSRTRVETVFQLLRDEAGIDPAHFAKVCAPIGLDIGARSPAEIALSIGAELVRLRRGGTGESLSRLGRDKVHRR